MYDIIWILCDITTTFTDIKRLYSWHHIHNIPEYRTDSIRHNIYYTCDITNTELWQDTCNVFDMIVYMRSHPLNEWQHKDCIWHDIQSICVIKSIWIMTSQPMYVWNHTHCMHDTIDTLHDITYILADNIPLFLCHGTNSVYGMICIIYDVTHTVCMTNPAQYLTWNTLKLSSLPLHMSSHPLFWRHHTYSVSHQRWHMYAIIWVIQDMISTLYDNLYY